MVINVDDHYSALHMISKDSDSASPAAKKGCFEPLVQISSSSKEGRDAISIYAMQYNSMIYCLRAMVW
jgi:hypothetical protein